MTGCTLSGNSSSGYGGGMILTQGSNQPIKYCTFTANNAAALGGGLACTGGSAPTVANCNFSSNAALEGAGIYCISGQPSFVSDTLFGNTANASSGTGGGGICSDTSANSGREPLLVQCQCNQRRQWRRHVRTKFQPGRQHIVFSRQILPRGLPRMAAGYTTSMVRQNSTTAFS